MITSRNDLKRYMEKDKEALFFGKSVGIFKLFKNDIFRFQRILRITEYLTNTRKGPISLILYVIYKVYLKSISLKLGFSIPVNVFDEGLSIAHYGNIVINPKVKIGKNCRIHVGVNIGSDARNASLVPRIGDNVYIGPGAKIFGDILIGNNTVIGANAVVNKSFPEGGITIGGIPATKISNRDSSDIINCYNK